MDVLAAAERRARTHGDVIPLCVGQPAPRVVREAVRDALGRDVLGYTTARGLPALREAIAATYAAQRGLAVDPDAVVITNGSSGGFSTILLAALDPGATVAMVRPGYPAYRNTMHALGLRVLELPAGRSERFQPSVAMLEAALAAGERIDALVVASPANPTGTVVDADELRRLALWCEAHGVLLLSDEIYHGIAYGRRCASAWEFSREAVVMGSFSKYHSMTGWRVGWALLPEHLRRPVELLQANLAICAPAVSQAAAIAACTDRATEELDGHVRRYAANRDLLLRRLPELGITSFAPPDGAFYAWCDVGHLTDDSLTWCERLLDATGVAITSGIDFDLVDGHRFVRVSFCGDGDQLDEAVDRIRGWVG